MPKRDVNIPAEGAFNQPPPGAPLEVIVPGSERPTMEQIHRARSNEQDLPAFAPKPMTPEQMRAFLGKDPSQVVLGDVVPKPAPAATSLPRNDSPAAMAAPMIYQPARSSRRVVTRPSVGLAVESVPSVAADAGVADDSATKPPAQPTIVLTDGDQPALPPPLPHQRAASDTDTPSRGLPTASADPGKQITGGFGDLGQAQYFPLDGTELREVVYHLLQSLHDRLEDDLRFSIAATYPRVAVRCVIEVEGYGGEGASFEIPKLAVPHEKTPIEVARQHGDHIVFCVVEQHREMTSDGESVTPPNAIRQELGLGVPVKASVSVPGAPGGRMIVDVVSEPRGY